MIHKMTVLNVMTASVMHVDCMRYIIQYMCRATMRPPHPWLTAECLRLIARLRET